MSRKLVSVIAPPQADYTMISNALGSFKQMLIPQYFQDKASKNFI